MSRSDRNVFFVFVFFFLFLFFFSLSEVRQVIRLRGTNFGVAQS